MNQTIIKYLKVLPKTFKFFKFFLYICFCTSCVPTIDLFSETVSADSRERFYIKFDIEHYQNTGIAVPEYELSSDEEISLMDCGVEKGSESFEDTYCILDLNEADIGVLGQAEEGIPIQYNIPREMCEYTTFIAPWHWNQRSGIGPKEVHECKLTSLGENAQEKTFIRVPPDGGWIEQTDDQEQSCEYDLSKSGLSNCCFGKAKAIPYKGTGYSSRDCQPDPESDPTDKEWGGDLKNCIGGPLRSSGWEAYQKVSIPDETGKISYELEFPIQNIFSSWTEGERETFMVGPVIAGVVLPSSTPSTNHFDGIEDLLFTSSNNCPNCPLMFFPDDLKKNDLNQTILPIGHPYFTLECLDSNFETLHRVHLTIREWNTKEELLNFKDSDGRSGDPDIEGEEGSDCSFYDSDEILRDTHSQCNDFLDLDDHTTLNRYPNIQYEGSGS